jgi:ABC-type molybdate transport system substrate-binding protein
MRIISIFIATLLLIISTVANSAELKVFASRAVWTVLQEIGPAFEKETGHKLALVTGLSPEFLKRINAGGRSM